MATRLNLSRYISSFNIDLDKSVNNQTIDEQLVGSLTNLRPCVSKGIQSPKVIEFAEKGFRASHDLYLECILRQSRTPGENYIWDGTSKLNDIAHGRQLAVDALYYMRHVGISTQTGQLVFETMKTLLGSTVESLFSNVFNVRDIISSASPVVKMSEDKKGGMYWAEYTDKKRQRYRFKGDCDMSTLKVEEDWE